MSLNQLVKSAQDRAKNLQHFDDGNFELQAVELLGFIEALWFMAEEGSDMREELDELSIAIEEQRKERFE